MVILRIMQPRKNAMQERHKWGIANTRFVVNKQKKATKISD